MIAQPSVTTNDVRRMIDHGVAQTTIVKRLASTGIWSEAGAQEIVRFMATGPDPLLANHLKLVRNPPRRRGHA